METVVREVEVVDFSVDCRYIAPMSKCQTTENLTSGNKNSNGSQKHFLENFTIGILEGLIKALLPTEDFYKLYKTENRIDLQTGSYVLLPGLINCHTHTALSLLRGYADDKGLSDWLRKYLWPTEQKFVNKDFVKLGTEMAVYEMLKSGTTMFNDMYYFPEETIKVCKKANIRVAAGKPVIDLGNNQIMKEVEESIDFARKYVKDKDDLVFPTLPPHTLYTLSPKYHQLLADASKSLNVIYHTHLNETHCESLDFIAKTGKSTVQSLEEAGGLDKNSVLAHCVWLTDEEKGKIGKSGASVCHCPRSNMKLGCGTCDVRGLMAANVNVCLGTDSACSNNTLDMLAEAQMACLLAKVNTLDASVLDDYTALEMCTINGAKALHCDDILGSLEVGKLCDMICVDLGALENYPIFDPFSVLIYTNARKIKYSWIGGKMVVKDGEVLTIKPSSDELRDVVAKLKEYREKIVASELKSDE